MTKLGERLLKSAKEARVIARGETEPARAFIPPSVDVDEACGMDLSEFRIGVEFLCGSGRWRCTDIGTRVVVAIRIDEAEISAHEAGKPVVTRTITGVEAEALGWLDGPPYGVVEHVFDEDDREACSPVED